MGVREFGFMKTTDNKRVAVRESLCFRNQLNPRKCFSGGG